MCSLRHRPEERRKGGAEFSSAQTSEIQRRRSSVLLSTDPGWRAPDGGTARAELRSAQHRPGEHREGGAEFSSAQTSEIQQRRSSVLLSTDPGGPGALRGRSCVLLSTDLGDTASLWDNSGPHRCKSNSSTSVSLQCLEDTTGQFTNPNFQEVFAHTSSTKDASETRGSEGKERKYSTPSSGQKGRKPGVERNPRMTVSATRSFL
ncbi:uncharacterized protein LOC134738978 [Pongo pygmaeus]|uniref:uncharacterized protein LOC134738978 n=1 Tax=Pongo pygmaeus TaxID=9600 RepID=UPI00300C8896